MNKNKLQKGFTLVELIISIALIAIIVGISFSNLGGHQKKLEVDLEAEKIVAYLRETRNRAIAGQDNSSWGIHFVNVSNGDDYYNLFKGLTFSTSAIVETRFLSKKIQFLIPAINENVDVVFLKSSGELSSSEKIIILQSIINPEITSTIEINKLGQINY
ncbi:MAG TPA: prepilin-type N-terminal cleavage/methylation domain-containing protein [Candidatus Paceibacterota bacterium]|nr:prepilin-type N-terminal cleavage/methylation domain-containing protein [Parcubacteria group bacterium]HOM33348.1 prepilin-type N-terminal cleavage/methylation domain-containing protein [Candidatus Paceibacterota bacterium]HRU35866.1 prepilin-type N-terminal cleavage/methylation domain-containing protein [Candidatus Paceibacterota bacterium]